MEKIEPGKPLPDHTKLRYEECYAKIILENLFSERYGNFAIKDKPDLIDEQMKTGVEVTDCTPKDKREAEKLWYMIPHVSAEQQLKNIARMQELGFQCNRVIQTWPTRTYTENIDDSPVLWFLKAVKSKVRKLNNGAYIQLNDYDLFVFSEIFIPDYLLLDSFRRLHEINVGLKTFRYIYLETNQNTVLAFDMGNNTGKTISFDEHQYEWAVAARKMVEDGEDE